MGVPQMVPYDEFGLFHERRRVRHPACRGTRPSAASASRSPPGRTCPSLVWGSATPELVLVHGGAQNAHTWDTVALALGRPLLAVDLPGHAATPTRRRRLALDGGQRKRPGGGRGWLRPALRGVVGMSLGGMSSIALASHAPELVRALVLVDVTPGVNEEKAAPITNFVNGPASFDSFDELLARTIEHNPGRSESSLRRGILRAVQREDGSWVWRYARFRTDGAVRPEFGGWWEAISELRVPVMLVRGLAWSVVDGADVDELLRRQPAARVEGVAGAGHSIQGDRPLELAALIEDFLFGSTGDGG